MRASSIDIGTNTVLLLVSDIDGSGIVRVVHDEQAIARLGSGVDGNRKISLDTIERACGFLEHFRDVSNLLGSERIIAVGTSALRDARNSDVFRRVVRERTGIEIEIISGESEGEWTFKGAISDFPELRGEFTVLDIGGGSTEIIRGDRTGINAKKSHDVGCVRLTERYLKTGPPSRRDIEKARIEVKRHFPADLPSKLGQSHVVGVAGTLTTLASYDQKLAAYDPLKVTGYRLTKEAVDKAFEVFSALTTTEIKAVPQVTSGREDIITAGILILQEFMKIGELREITVSDRGLRYGILLRESARLAGSSL